MQSQGLDSSIDKIKTGSFERRLSLTKAGLVAGTKYAGQLGMSMFKGREAREAARSKALSDQAQYLASELGKLKGSVVKIGQVMALYGEHFLPVEVTEALRTLEENTQALDWPIIRGVLYQELGHDKMAALEIGEEPIGTASLGQVHKAKIKATGEWICLKVQYPGVAEAVDVDLDAVAQLLRLTQIVRSGQGFDDWLEEVRIMMHREVDYELEARTTHHFSELLALDSRFVVPSVFFDYSTSHVLATSFEVGEHITHPKVAQLDQYRRNHLAKAALELFLNELYRWHEIQTDPNFGNYRIRIDEEGDQDKVVLLDFGAVQAYPLSFIEPVCAMIDAAYKEDLSAVIDGGVVLGFMHREWPQSVLDAFGQICIDVLEPLSEGLEHRADAVLNEQGEYCWTQSNLPTRIAKRAAVSAVSRYFKVPPREFVFLNRKLVGVYTFISVLNAEFNGRDLLSKYVRS